VKRDPQRLGIEFRAAIGRDAQRILLLRGCWQPKMQVARTVVHTARFFVAGSLSCAYSLVRISSAGAPIAQLDRALVYGF